MNYQETVDWMFQQLPMYQKIGKRAFRTDLSNIQKLVQHLDDSQHAFKSIHVAGTNGKGSVSHILASVSQENGFKTGLYTSPHLKDFRERIKINGKEIPESAVIQFVSTNKDFLEKGDFSFFEMTVGMAFWYFAREKVDIALIETGLGGRLDSTNIITPEISIITNIGLDHTAMLGNSLAEIAAEKAGIIKENIPVVIGETNPKTLPVFKQKAEMMKAPIFFAENNISEIPGSDLKGTYQKRNIRTAWTALEVLKGKNWKFSSEAIKKGIQNVVKNTGLRGRWEILRESPKVIADTAHNKEGLIYVMDQLKEENFDRLHIVFGVVNDKDLNSILPLLPKTAIFYFCRPNVPRGMDAEVLMQEAIDFGLKGETYSSVSQAYNSAL
ncbi:MAG TPA: folylpolyglutamate synthase/dihydrofolate synthase family protein, partial [Salinimicrobium sp.]|nr:folylpolyglutamate synthase/dihydrofolate synthase family protein [Salinimicrobium sp.]